MVTTQRVCSLFVVFGHLQYQAKYVQRRQSLSLHSRMLDLMLPLQPKLVIHLCAIKECLRGYVRSYWCVTLHVSIMIFKSIDKTTGCRSLDDTGIQSHARAYQCKISSILDLAYLYIGLVQSYLLPRRS